MSSELRELLVELGETASAKLTRYRPDVVKVLNNSPVSPRVWSFSASLCVLKGRPSSIKMRMITYLSVFNLKVIRTERVLWRLELQTNLFRGFLGMESFWIQMSYGMELDPMMYGTIQRVNVWLESF